MESKLTGNLLEIDIIVVLYNYLCNICINKPHELYFEFDRSHPNSEVE
jgi:hypothetical protein